MNMRLFPILGITGLFSIALAGSAVAGGGGWPPAPGSYKMTDTSATADLVGAMIADGDFSVAKDLSSASLSTTVEGESNCPGAPLAVSSTNVVTGKGGGGGGGGGGTATPVTLNLSWTYKGVVSHGHDDGILTCGTFKTSAQQDSDHASATAQGQITGASATLTSQYAYIDNSSSNQVIKGAPIDACFS